MDYDLAKAAHILAATLLFGTGLGSAFNLWRAKRSGRVPAIAVVARSVVVADWVFTTPAALVLPATGAWMVMAGGWSWTAPWLIASLGLFALAGACWLPVVWLQIRMARLAAAASRDGRPLPAPFHRGFAAWFWLGWPAFSAVIVIVHLMVLKPEISL